MTSQPRNLNDDALLLRYQALLQVAESISSHRDMASLLRDLNQKLRAVAQFDGTVIVLHNAANNTMQAYQLEADIASDIPVPVELPVDEAPGGWVWKTQQPMLVKETARETRFAKMNAMLHTMGVKSYCVLPLTSAGRRLGAIGFSRLSEAAYTEEDLEFLQQVVNQVAIAVENALNFESAQASERQLARERDRLRLLLELSNAVTSHLNLSELFRAIAACMRQAFDYDYAGLGLHEPGCDSLRVYALDRAENIDFLYEGLEVPIKDTPTGLCLKSGKIVLRHHLDPAEFPSETMRRAYEQGVRSGCTAPLISRDRTLGIITMASSREMAFTEDDAELLGNIAGQISIAVENALAFREIEQLKNKLSSEKLYLEEELQTTYNFQEIIGQSQALRRILKQVETAAPTDSTILIQGETGTGKELIARAIHNLSTRRERTLVKVNCAAIPTGLLESELFGHEKGAFTGAVSPRAGRFELAHLGTLFLDEVGDIPLELQPKLLRVLQEKEFERLGSSRTLRVDVRLVAATNCDLASMVADKKYRSDLYYRLNVFPITLPPLRERPEDIPVLARFFAQKFARRMRKRIESISAQSLAALNSYTWPGNVRELENLIERAVILTQGNELEIPHGELKSVQSPLTTPTEISTLESAEREHILLALKETNWVIGGPSGAAARLGMKRTTLQSKMQKLGISRLTAR